MDPRDRIDPAIARPAAEQTHAIGKTAKSEEDVRLNVERDVRAASRAVPASALTLIALAASAILLLVIALPLWTGRIYPADDMAALAFPIRNAYAQGLAAGENFLWWPALFCGYDLHGDGNAGLLHPMHLCLYRLLPIGAAMNLELLVNYVLMLPGMYLFLRRWGFRRDACLFGAMAFTFCGFNLLHYLHAGVVGTAAHIPWLLWAVDISLRDADERRAAWARLAVGLLTASQLTFAFPQVVWFTAILEVTYVAAVFSSGVRVSRVLALGVAKGLGVLAGAIQLAPTLAALGASARADATQEFLDYGSVFPANFAQFVGPYVFGMERRVLNGVTHETGIYSGAVVTALLLLVLLQRKEMPEHRRLWVWCFLLAGASLILSLGKYGQVYHLQSYLPLVGKFRCPCRYILLFQFAAAIVGTMAFAWLSRCAEERRPVGWGRLWPLGLLPLGGIAAVVLIAAWLWVRPACWATPLVQERAGSVTNMILSVGLVLAGTLLVVAAARGQRWAFAGMILFVALDQGLYGVSYMWQDPPATLQEVLAREPAPPDPVTGRIHVASAPYGNIATAKGCRLSNGYIGMTPKKRLPPLSRNSLRVAGVEWVRDDGGPDREEAIPSWMQETLVRSDYGWRLPAPLPRARMVCRTVGTGDPASCIEQIDVGTTALLPAALALPEGAPGTAAILVDRPGRITVLTQAESRQFLVLSESYHSGWRATVDGQPTPVIAAYGDFMGCVVESGEHRVQWLFRPRSVIVGAWISLAGIAGLLVQCGIVWLRPRRAQVHPPPATG